MNTERNRLSKRRRLLLSAIGGLGLTLLVVARNFEPDPRGFGTHEQQGWSPCYFRKLTGEVCPLCGTTTAWAWTVRGNLAQAIAANLGGTLLCVGVGTSSLWLLTTAASGQRLVKWPSTRVAMVIASVWLVVAVLDWLRRVANN